MNSLLSLMLSLHMTANAEPPICDTAAEGPSEQGQTLDLFQGTLEGEPPAHWVSRPTSVEVTPSSLEVDEAWQGDVTPELRTTTPRAVQKRLGPPALSHDADAGWEVSYGCLVLQIEDGAIGRVSVHHQPCSAALPNPSPEQTPTSAQW